MMHETEMLRDRRAVKLAFIGAYGGGAKPAAGIRRYGHEARALADLALALARAAHAHSADAAEALEQGLLERLGVLLGEFLQRLFSAFVDRLLQRREVADVEERAGPLPAGRDDARPAAVADAHRAPSAARAEALAGRAEGEVVLGIRPQNIYPAAIAPAAGGVNVDVFPYDRLRPVAIRAITGETDLARPSVEATVARARAAGLAPDFVLVPGGNHASSVEIAAPATFDFFAAHRRPGG